MGELFLFGMFLDSFFLGVKHSLDVDHVAAVSSLLLKSPKITHTIKMSIYWSLGHTLTAGIITVIFFLLTDVFLTSFLVGFELLVAILLIIIGVITLILESYRRSDAHSHSHSHHFHFFKKGHHTHSTEVHPHKDGNGFFKINNSHLAIVLIGILQGLASNDELLIIVAFTLNFDNLITVLIGIVLFSIGVTTGMIGWSSLMNLPKIKGKQEKIMKWLNITIGIIAIVYGTYLLLGGEGINLITFLG